MKIKFCIIGWLALAGFLFLTSSTVKAVPQRAQTEESRWLLPIFFNRFDQGFGGLTGTVLDATNSQPINGTQVCLDGINCDITEENGIFSFASIYSGRHEADVAHEGYIPLEQPVWVSGNITRTLVFALSPDLAAGAYRIILTWGATPHDLDTYFWTPYESYPLVWYNARGDCDDDPNTCLDVDDRDGYGPETVSLIYLADSGSYAYAVYNVEFFKPGIPPITASQARVRLYNAEGLIQEFITPATGEGGLWYVFDMDAFTGEVTPKNCITNYPAVPERPACLEPKSKK